MYSKFLIISLLGSCLATNANAWHERPASPPPTVSFNFNSDNANPPCAGTSIQFTSTVSGATNIAYAWSFGDGNSSDQANPSHTFNPVGSDIQEFVVSLMVTDLSDTTSTTVMDTVRIRSRPDVVLRNTLGGEILEFSNCNAASSASPAFNISFTDASVGSITQYNVDWGDGTGPFSDAAAPTGHNYTSLDIYTLAYTVTNSNGCQTTENFPVLNVSNPAIGVANQGNSSGCAPQSLTFSINGFASNHTSTLYTVDPGDGSAPTVYNHPPPSTFTHNYTGSSCSEPSSSYTLTIEADNGCTPTPGSTGAISIYTPTIASFAPATDLICENTSLSFSNTSQQGYNQDCSQNTRYEWDFGDGGTTVTFDHSSVHHTYTSSGTYTVTMQAINFCDTTQHTEVINVTDAVPNASFTASANGQSGNGGAISGGAYPSWNLTSCAPLTINFTGSSDPTATVIWSVTGGAQFGNGQSSTDVASPSLTVNTGGTYTVTCVSTTACASETLGITFTVDETPSPPTLAGTVSDVCQGNTIDFGTGTISGATGYTWDVIGINGTANPAISEDLNQADPPAITLPAGEYEVSLDVTSACGNASDQTTFRVIPFPSADISPSGPITQCSGGSETLTTSNNPAYNYQWYRDGLSVSGGNSATLAVSSTGNYFVEVDNDGCAARSDTVVVAIQSAPSLNPSISGVTCAGDTVQLVAGAIGATAVQWEVSGLGGTPNPSLSVNLAEETLAPFMLPAGSYRAKVEASSACGIKQDSIDFTIHPLPSPTISPAVATICAGNTQELLVSNVGTNGGSLRWYRNGTAIAGATDTVYLASEAGDYTVRATALGCSGTSAPMTLNLLSAPQPTVSASGATTFCEAGEINTTLTTTTATGYTYQWYQNDTAIAGAVSPNLPISGVGSYRVVLSNGICEVSSSPTQVALYPPLLPTFSSPDSLCVGTSLSINAQVSGYTSGELNYAWAWGDGATDSTAVVTHEYNNPGNYTLSLEVTSIAGNCQAVASANLQAVAQPVADFNISQDPTSGCGTVVAEFDNQSSGARNTYNWNFDNGATSTLQIPDPQTYLPSRYQDTMYTVTLAVNSPVQGCNPATASAPIVVHPLPEARFVFEEDVTCADYPLSIFNYSIGQSYQYFWDFGDGSLQEATDTTGIITHQFPYAGLSDTTYYVTLTAINACDTNSLTLPIVVEAKDVQAFMQSSPRQGCAPLTVQFQSNQSGQNELIWQWGDADGGGTTTTPNPRYTYQTPGTYEASLMVRNGCNIDTAYRTIEVYPSPEVDFTVNAPQCAGDSVQIINQTRNPHNTIFDWDLGNGEQATGQTIAPTVYPSAGNYTVELVGTFLSNGCTDTARQTVEIVPYPVAQFSAPEHVCQNESWTLTQESTNYTQAWWSLGLERPFFQDDSPAGPAYPESGPQTLTLAVSNALGCMDTVQHEIYVAPTPIPQFDIVPEDSSYQSPLTVYFENTTEIPDLFEGTFQWDLGNGQSPKITIAPAPVTYENTWGLKCPPIITLTATSSFGCTASISDSLNVEAAPCEGLLKLPTAFSPNDDGNNDLFRLLIRTEDEIYRPVTEADLTIEDGCMPDIGWYAGYSLSVINRHGVTEFYTESPAEAWDGLGVPDGVYFVRVKFPTRCQSSDSDRIDFAELMLVR